MEIVKAGTTELTKESAEKIYTDRKYVCNYSGIYQPHKSADGKQIFFRKVISIKGYAARGRFYIQDAKSINHILGSNILADV